MGCNSELFLREVWSERAASRLQSALLHVAVTGKGEDGKPWRPLCPGAVSEPVPKLAVVLVKEQSS